MSISAIPSVSLAQSTLTATQNVRNRVQQDFDQIAKSLQSGDLSGARNAYSDAVSLAPGGNSAQGPVQSDLANLGKALDSGDLSGAQSAFSKLKTDFATASGSSSAVQGHHHHHRHATQDSDSTANSVATTSTQTSDSGSSILGSLVKTGLSLLA